MKKQKLLKKIFVTAINVVLCLFLLLSALTVAFTVFSRGNGDAAEIFGYQMRIVISKSMEECESTDVSKYEIKSLPLNTMVFVESVPDDKDEADRWYSELKVGDVLTFKYTFSGEELPVVITHRIADISENSAGGYTIRLVGDNKNYDSKQLVQTINTAVHDDPYNYVIGKVVGSSLVMGKVISFLQEPLAIVLLIILPCFIIIIFEVLRLTRMFRNKREKEKMDLKEKEIEELRRRLEMLENQNSKSSSDTGDVK